MDTFLRRHAGSVTGVLSGFDRLLFAGSVGMLANTRGMLSVLYLLKVLLKDFATWAQDLTATLRAAVERQAADAGVPAVYVNDSSVRKEELAWRIAAERGVVEGPVCLLSAVEPCRSYDVFRNRRDKRLELVRRPRKCLHYYQYLIHPELGFCHVRLASWLPLGVRVCVNGREMLARQMDRAGIAYERRDNCFAAVSDVAKAQALLEAQLEYDWAATLHDLADRANPVRRTMLGDFEPHYYWAVEQSEWASDVMFKDAAGLSGLYPRLARHGMLALGCDDVMRYLGRRVRAEDPRFHGQVITDLRHRGQGMRLKHRLNANSIKVYDKQHSVLRVETTINDPKDFRCYRRAGGDQQSKLCWRVLRKGVVDIKRRAEVSHRANQRYLEALAAVEATAALGELAAPLCRGVAGRGRTGRARPLNPLCPDDARLLQAVARGEFAINGFRNRDIRRLLYDGEPADARECKRRSGRVTRMLRMLRAHGLINKVPHTHRYVVSDNGRTAIAAILAARQADTSKLLAAA